MPPLILNSAPQRGRSLRRLHLLLPAGRARAAPEEPPTAPRRATAHPARAGRPRLRQRVDDRAGWLGRSPRGAGEGLSGTGRGGERLGCREKCGEGRGECWAGLDRCARVGSSGTWVARGSRVGGAEGRGATVAAQGRRDLGGTARNASRYLSPVRPERKSL